jgi:hypothetical protein
MKTKRPVQHQPGIIFNHSSIILVDLNSQFCFLSVITAFDDNLFTRFSLATFSLPIVDGDTWTDLMIFSALEPNFPSPSLNSLPWLVFVGSKLFVNSKFDRLKSISKVHESSLVL